MQEPAIKGSAIEALVQDLGRALREGTGAREEIEAGLRPADLELLDAKVHGSAWYPLDQYVRLTEALYAATGRGIAFEAFLHGRGEAAAERLIRAGIYQQLDFSGRGSDAPPEDLVRDTRLRLSLVAGMVNRGRAHVEPDPATPGGLRIELRDAAEIPDVLGHVIAAFVGRCSREGGRTFARWRARRIAPDVIRLSHAPA